MITINDDALQALTRSSLSTIASEPPGKELGNRRVLWQEARSQLSIPLYAAWHLTCGRSCRQRRAVVWEEYENRLFKTRYGDGIRAFVRHCGRKGELNGKYEQGDAGAKGQGQGQRQGQGKLLFQEESQS